MAFLNLCASLNHFADLFALYCIEFKNFSQVNLASLPQTQKSVATAARKQQMALNVFLWPVSPNLNSIYALHLNDFSTLATK